MKNLLMTLALAIALLPGLAIAEIRVERVEYTHQGTVLQGIIAYDDASDDKRPGVLVCHEWWGCNDYAEFRCRELAKLGYVAFALDMYGKGNVTTDPKRAGEWAGALYKDEKALRARAAAGLKVLVDHPRTDKSRLAAIGYCMGGTVALELARSGLPHTENLRAIVAFHTSTLAAKGDEEKVKEDTGRIAGSVLICHGAADTFVPAEEIERFKAQMAAAGDKDYQFVEYSGAVHAFTNPKAQSYGVPGVAHQEAADRRSWLLMQSLFKEAFAARKE